MEKVDLCQAGARSNRGPADNIFIVNAVIDHKIKIKIKKIKRYLFSQVMYNLEEKLNREKIITKKNIYYKLDCNMMTRGAQKILRGTISLEPTYCP